MKKKSVAFEDKAVRPAAPAEDKHLVWVTVRLRIGMTGVGDAGAEVQVHPPTARIWAGKGLAEIVEV